MALAVIRLATDLQRPLTEVTGVARTVRESHVTTSANPAGAVNPLHVGRPVSGAELRTGRPVALPS